MSHLSQKTAIVAGGGRGIGHAVVFLVSEQARNLTGQALDVDGGIQMNRGSGLPEARSAGRMRETLSLWPGSAVG